MSTEIDYSKLDPKCVEMVKFFNSHGLPTDMSCQGHDTTEQSLYWISFDETVHTMEVVTFQSHYLNERGNFCAHGHFCKRLYLATEGELERCGRKGTAYWCWEYVVGSPEAAKADLEAWLNMDKNHRESIID